MSSREDLARAEPIWVRTAVGWHVAFWLFLVLVVVEALLADLRPGARIGVLSLYAALGLAYLTLGQPATRTRSRLQSHLYRLILVTSCAVATGLSPSAMFLLFVAFPQLWILSDSSREGAAYAVLLMAGTGTGLWFAAGRSWPEFREAVPWLVVSLAVSLVTGFWIDRVIEQSRHRGELIAELDATRGELAEANHTAGVMAERERMAREIHDTLAQGMTSIVMLAQAAQAELAAGRPTESSGKLAAIEDTARENLAEARALVAAFTPVALTELPLNEVLHRQAERFGAETGVDVRVELDLPSEEVAALSANQQVVLLRAAQEALANVRKHAAASHVLIRLGAADGRVSIEIADDGRGFEPDGVTGGFGLAAMRGRVEDSGGTVSVDSSPGHGTRIQVLVPEVP